ncbi:MAG TPA: MFS transporter [Rhodothermales bacterium]|nr:MFS transporter [Rhodothermales bacterium]
MASSSAQKLSFKEKAGYSVSDASANFVFQILIIFQAGFYTDVMGISAVALGTMLLLVRFSDAITDPVMGYIADRTKHRWGKFRPWLLWSAIPFAVLFWAAFTVPDLDSQGTLIYAVITYTLLMMAYTMNNVPYSALTGVMTVDTSERTSISTYRFFAAMAAAFVVQGLTLPLVDKLGAGNDAKGWSMTIAIFAVIAVVFFVITFFSVKERIQPPPGQKPDLKQDLKDIRKNVPWMAMFFMTLFVFITLSLRGSSYYYYFSYYVDADATRVLLEQLGLIATSTEGRGIGFAILDTFGLIITPESDPSSVGFSLFNMTGNMVNILGVLLAKPLADRFGSKWVFTIGLAGAAILQAFFFILEPTDVNMMFVLSGLIQLSYGPTIPLLWAMIADTADYSEWKNNRRSTGFVYSGIIFALKAGLGLGGAFAGWILAAYGYEVATARMPEVLAGIRMMASIYSAIPFAIGVICMLFYPITKAVNRQMSAELSARHHLTDS